MQRNIEFTEEDSFNNGFKYAIQLCCDGLGTLDEPVSVTQIMKGRLKLSKMREALEEVIQELDLKLHSKLGGEIA